MVRDLLKVYRKMAWLQLGSVFPFPVFSVPFFIDFFPFYSRCPHLFVCPSSHLFRVVATPHGALTVTLWANVDLACPSTALEKRNYCDSVGSCSRFSGDECRLGIYLWSVCFLGCIHLWSAHARPRVLLISFWLKRSVPGRE